MLVGRDKEQRELDQLIEGARAEHGGALVLRGDAGIGKTALLGYAEGHANGMKVLRAVGIESEHEMPFAGLDQLTRPCRGLIERLPPPQAHALQGALGLTGDAVDDRFLVSLGLLSLLSEAADGGALLCVIDDAQWLDHPSQDALVFAARRLEAEPVAVIAAAREGDPRRFDSAGLPELHVEGLADEDARALLEQRLTSTLPADVSDTLVRTAGGNPLALLELPSGLTERQLHGAEPIVGPVRAKGAVEEEFAHRVSALPDAARSMLLLAAANDTDEPGTLERAGERLGLGLPDLALAERAGLVHVDDGVRFRHPLVRSAVYRSATRSERKAAHHALADVLADQALSAWHRAVVTDGLDEGLAAELEAAGAQAAARGAHATASTAYERAADLTEKDDRRGHRLRCAAQAALDSGRSDAAVALAERARALVTDPFETVQLNLIRATEASRRGSIPYAHQLHRETAEMIAPVDPDAALELLVWALLSAQQGGWMPRAIADVERALDRIEATGDLARFARALVEGATAALRGEATLAGERLREALAISEGFGPPRMHALPPFVCLYMGDQVGARERAAVVTASNRTHGSTANIVGMMAAEAGMEIAVRRPQAAAAAADEAIHLARQLGYENDEAGLLAVQARVAALLGREEECRERAEDAIRRGLANGVGWAVQFGRLALGELEQGLGNARESIEQLELMEDSPLPPIAVIHVPDIIDGAVKLGETSHAAAALERLERWAPTNPRPHIQGLLARSRAMLADDAGDAERHFNEALDLHAHDTPPFDLARTQLAYGERLRREKRKSEARVQLRTALQTFEGMGAALWANRARGELSATGETARKRDPSTVDELTPQERRIAQLVATGASNREVGASLFVSPKTVEYHLRKVFLKLGVASRVELARLQLD